MTFGTVDIEKIVGLGAGPGHRRRAGFTPADAIAKLRSLEIPVLVVYAPSIDGVYKDIELVGTAVGASDKATALTDADACRHERRSPTPPTAESAKAAHQAARLLRRRVHRRDRPDLRARPRARSWPRWSSMLGVDVITGDPVTYEIPLEKLIERDPQVIILGVNAFYSPTADDRRRSGPAGRR